MAATDAGDASSRRDGEGPRLDGEAGPSSSRAPLGIDEPQVTAWLADHVGVVPPLRFHLIAGGHSNLTYRITDAGGQGLVLRRGPLGHVLATAHDMGREHRIISALGPTPVPVPPARGFCADPAVNGAPFYVMDLVEGVVVHDTQEVEALLSVEQRQAAGESIVDVLAAIHAVDPDAVGLGDLGRREGYIERQLKRWHRQWEQSKTRELSAVDEVHAALMARIPEQGPATICHGDYRLDNTLLGPDGRIRAVLDWELCTLGDPLADVGMLMVFWDEPEDPHTALPTGPTQAPGFPRRAELLEHYGRRSGRDVSQIDFYVAFGYWKLACILEGVYSRYRGGALGEAAAGFEAFGEHVVLLAQDAADAVERVG